MGKISEHDKQAETYFDNIAQILKESTDKYFPLKQTKRRAPKKLWITNRIKRHIAIRDKLYQVWIKTKTMEDHQKNKQKRNHVNMEIK